MYSPSYYSINPSEMKQVWFNREEDYHKVMVWATAKSTFFTFYHFREITVLEGKAYDTHSNLSYRDILVDNVQDPSIASIVSFLQKQSKNDQARQAVKVYMGKTRNDICPVKALLDYLKLRGPKEGSLFMWKDGSPLQKPQCNKAVKMALTQAKLPANKFVRVATTVAFAGMEDSTIQILGC